MAGRIMAAMSVYIECKVRTHVTTPCKQIYKYTFFLYFQ
jgi:hypothetical protein